MSFNPLKEKPVDLFSSLINWKEMYPASYNKDTADPYTKTRIILMNGTEFEAVWFGHHFSRHCNNNELRRDLALARRIEQQQQKEISCLKPINENILETTISYEQLAVDLTALLAKKEPDNNVKKALNFALLEDFDHLYRYADLLDLEFGIKAEKLVGGYTEIMPARPTISHHRHPFDDIRYHIDGNASDMITKLHVNIITAAEQQTMNYYMNVAGFYSSDLGRKLYQEIGMVEEEHVSSYGSLIDTTNTLIECLIMHEYTECYLYYSCYMDETDKNVKSMWERHLIQEIAMLHKAKELLQKYEGRDIDEVIPDGEFPELLSFKESNIDYVRTVLNDTVNLTSKKEDYVELNKLNDNADFFMYNSKVNGDTENVPSHNIIKKYIETKGIDYRYETKENPIPELRDRKTDNVKLGRCKK